MLSAIDDFDRATSSLLSRCQNESSCEAIHMKMCYAYRFISCKSNRLCEWTRFETEAQSSLVMAYCAASASFLRITSAHVRDLMTRAVANGLGTITNHEKMSIENSRPRTEQWPSQTATGDLDVFLQLAFVNVNKIQNPV